MARYLVTGAAGFIGHWLASRLLGSGSGVVGIDNLNDAYDPRIKRWRLERLRRQPGFRFAEASVADRDGLAAACGSDSYDAVFHLAARAGAPQSVLHPSVYIEANALGTQNVLELCTARSVRKLVLASTSSVYGEGGAEPLGEDAGTDRPLSPYAASKKAAEALAHAHHSAHGLDVTVLRYFTVYGAAGRPDMSLFRFIRWIREGEPVVLHGDGSQSRDFTFVDDIVRGTVAAVAPAGFEIVNLGSSAPVALREALSVIEDCLGRKARIRAAPVPATDVRSTWADIRKAGNLLRWQPETPLQEGIESAVRWYADNRDWARDLDLP